MKIENGRENISRLFNEPESPGNGEVLLLTIFDYGSTFLIRHGHMCEKLLAIWDMCNVS